MSDQLHFDASNHVFTYDGRRIPGVTQILKEEGFIKTQFYTEEARLRGEEVHKATVLMDQDRFEGNSLNNRIQLYLHAYDRFRMENEIQISEIEKIVYFYKQPIRYAGILDRTFLIDNRLAIQEIKTGYPAKWHRLQLIAMAKPTDECQDYSSYICDRRHSIGLKNSKVENSKVFHSCGILCWV